MTYELAIIIGLLAWIGTELRLQARQVVRKVEMVNPGHVVSGVVRVLKRDGERWIPGHYVRENSAAYQEAMDTPGLAIQDSAGQVVLGKQ